METKFSTASLDNIADIQAIASVTFPATYSHLISKEQLDWMYDWMYSTESLTQQFKEGHDFQMLSVDGETVGFISIQKEKDAEYLFYFQKIYLHPKMHKRGLGRVLLEHGFEYVLALGIENPRVELHANRENPAVEFYKKLGFDVYYSKDFEVHEGYFMRDHVMFIYPKNRP